MDRSPLPVRPSTDVTRRAAADHGGRGGRRIDDATLPSPFASAGPPPDAPLPAALAPAPRRESTVRSSTPRAALARRRE